MFGGITIIAGLAKGHAAARRRRAAMEFLGIYIVGLAFFGSHAWADTVLFTNGPAMGGQSYYSANYPGGSTYQHMYDDFVLAGDATVTGITYAEWIFSSAGPGNLTWSILSDSSDAPGNVLFAGTVSASDLTVVSTDPSFPEVDDVSFAIPAASLSAGHYWLSVYSDQKNGWGVAAPNATDSAWFTASNGNHGRTNAQLSFSLSGELAAAPLPAAGWSGLAFFGLLACWKLLGHRSAAR